MLRKPHNEIVQYDKARGELTVFMEIVEDTEDRMVLRGWITSSEWWWRTIQYSGYTVVLAGLAATFTIFSVPVVMGGLAAIFLGGGSALIAFDRRCKGPRRRPWLSRATEVEWRRSSSGPYREGGAGRLISSGRQLDARGLRKIAMLEMRDGGRSSWTVLLHHDDCVLEPFPPIVGNEENLRKALRALAKRCDASFIEQ